MILSEFRTLIRAYVPSAKVSVIPTDLLDTLINKAVEEVNVRARALPSSTAFTTTANIATYSLLTYLPRYVTMNVGGLWWNSGTVLVPDWTRLEAFTRGSLQDIYTAWMNDAAGDPKRYIIEGDSLIIHPTPDATLAGALWAFYIAAPVAMTADTHYPFSGSTSEITSLTVFDDAIIDYVRWKLSRPLGTDQQGIITEKNYMEVLTERTILYENRLDIGANNSRMRGPSI